MTKHTVDPAWMTWPGSTSFSTTVPPIGARTAISGRTGASCSSAALISAGSTP